MIFPESLDATCQAVLLRSQSAMTTIACSEVRAAGLLENPVDDATLRQHEWEIAVKLREITSLRAMLADGTAGAPSGPMTSRVLSGQQRAVELAQHATTARVAALESYASQIRAADDAERDWQQATTLSRRNDTYLDLAASTAADDWAAGELAFLTQELTAAAQARRERLHDVDLAASVLILPQPRP